MSIHPKVSFWKREHFAPWCIFACLLATCTGAAESTAQRIKDIRSTRDSVQIELYSPAGFEVRNEIAVLEIGSREFSLSSYPSGGDTKSLIFTLTPEEFAQLRDGERVFFKYGRGDSGPKRDFGKLDKSRFGKK